MNQKLEYGITCTVSMVVQQIEMLLQWCHKSDDVMALTRTSIVVYFFLNLCDIYKKRIHIYKRIPFSNVIRV